MVPQSVRRGVLLDTSDCIVNDTEATLAASTEALGIKSRITFVRAKVIRLYDFALRKP